MTARLSRSDRAFVRRFETGDVAPEEFDHRAHLRLAYGYLCGSSADRAYPKMRAGILSLLDRNGIGRAKYHETVTVAWLQAVHYFMRKAGEIASFDELLEDDDRLLDTSIMLTHYSKARLFSDEARLRFLPPDLDPIPLEAPLDG